MWKFTRKKKKNKKKKRPTSNGYGLEKSTTLTTASSYCEPSQREPTLRKQKPIFKQYSKSVGCVEEHHTMLFPIDHLRHTPSDDINSQSSKTKDKLDNLGLQKSISSISSAFDVDTRNSLEEKLDNINDQNGIKTNYIYAGLKMWDKDKFTDVIWNKQCSINSFDDCYCIQRLLYIMKYYHASENRPTKYPQIKMMEVLDRLKTYNAVMLTNDYIHVKETHLRQDSKLVVSDDEEEEDDVVCKADIKEHHLIHEYFSEQCLDDDPCETDFCKCVERNFRDRTECGRNDKYLRDLYRNNRYDNNENDTMDNISLNIIHKQILDTIHCAMFHPQTRINDKVVIDNDNKQRIIPSGTRNLFRPISVSYFEHSMVDNLVNNDEPQFNYKYRRSTLVSDTLTLNVKQPTLSAIKFSINDRLTPRQSKKKLFQESMKNLNAEYKISKQISNTMSAKLHGGEHANNNTEYIMNEEKLDGNNVKNNDGFGYQFGIKMIYDKHSREGPQNVFNMNKNSCLHDELLNNKIMTISQQQWENCMEKALIKIKTIRARQIIGKRGKYVSKSMELLHVMAILLYCNYDELQRQFRSTFRRKHKDESDSDVRKRHENYFWWGKLLHEAIYCFGQDIKTQDICVYHGLQQKLLFSQFEACFYSPLSTTRDLCIAASFKGSNDEGIILKLVKSEDYSAYYLDVSYLSDFCDEDERLFHCSNKGFHLHIYSIIYDTIDYRKYVASLNLLDQIVNPDYFISYDKKPRKQHQKRLVRMMKHYLNEVNGKKKCVDKEQNKHDSFIDELSEYFYTNKISIGISLERDDLSMFIPKLADYILELTISCDIFKLFPNMQQLLVEFIEYNEKQLIKFIYNFIGLLIISDGNRNKSLYNVMFTDIFVASNNKEEFNKMLKVTWPNLLSDKGWIVTTNHKYPGRMELRKNSTRAARFDNVKIKL